jgi:histidinol-phosphate aminotransferase
MRFNPVLETLEAYVPGEQPQGEGFVKLNTNECPYSPAPSVIEALIRECNSCTLQKYPDPTSRALREAIAERYGLQIEWVLVGNGSDEILRLVCHAFLTPGDCIAMLYPTYVLYRTLAAMFGAGCQEFDVSAPTYTIPEEAFRARCQIFFIANPNPPLGTLYSIEEIEKLAALNPQRLVVVDEAYADFAGLTAIDLVKRYENVAVSRTFSKSYALAGARVGFLIARPKIINQIWKLKDSYNVNRMSQTAALAAWKAQEYYSDIVRKICETRKYLRNELIKRGFTVPESAGNFLLARREDARMLYQNLKARKVLVRYFDARLLQDAVRITIGTKEEVDQLLKAIDEIDGVH